MRGAAHTKILSGRPAATEKEGTGMFETKTLRRLVAGVGAFALAAAGLLGVGTAHADDEPSPGNITGTAGDLYVHKHKGDPGAGTAGDGTQLDPLPDPLEGVEFTVQRVGHTSQDPIDLTTTQGWDLLNLGSIVPLALTAAALAWLALLRRRAAAGLGA